MAAPRDEDTPAVTVLMPVRNGGAFIEAAARSILGQSLRSPELLVVDDGSTDGTAAVLARLVAEDGRVRVLRQPALGLVPALNRGLAEARAPLIARMDADDVAAPERLERQAAVLDAAPELALVGTGWRVLAPDGRTRRVVRPPITDAAISEGMRRANVLAHPTVMYRRHAVLEAGGYRAAFLRAEDYDLWLRLLDRWQAACVPEPLLEYREHAGQSAWQDLEQRILSEMAAQAASACRVRSVPDCGDDEMPVDRARLRLMGMSEAEIAAGMIARALGRRRTRAARLGLGQPCLRARTRLHLWALAALATAAARVGGRPPT